MNFAYSIWGSGHLILAYGPTIVFNTLWTWKVQFDININFNSGREIMVKNRNSYSGENFFKTNIWWNKKQSWYKKTNCYMFVRIMHSRNFILSSFNKYVYVLIPIATWNYECCWPHDVLKCCQNEFVCNGEEVGSNHSPSSVGLKFLPLLARTFGQSFEEFKLPMNLEVQIDNVRQ